jgi:hypothetical protein
LWLLLVPAAALMLSTPAWADGHAPDLMVDYLLFDTNLVPSAATCNLLPSESTFATVASAPLKTGSELRWEKFEADFGVKQKDPSLVKSSIESAQYKLDETVFAAKELVQDFRYDTYLTDLTTGSAATRAPRRYYSDPVMDSWEHCQIQSGAEWDEKTGHAFVGVRLVLPFGD